MGLFTQTNFVGGLNTELDATKTPPNSYRLLVNGRTRRDIVEPTRKHLQIAGPAVSNYQGLYAVGDIIVLFAGGLAYYADITADVITFKAIGSFPQMDALVSRIYAEIVPASSNQFQRAGTPDLITKTFRNTIATFPRAMFVFDGLTVQKPVAISPIGEVKVLGDFNSWTIHNPEYVPFGKLPCQVGNKLFLVSPDGLQIYQGVSGRSNDFMVNITNSGDKGGDASTVAQTVSFNQITSLKPLSTGQVLVSTLYASFALELDFNNTIFGEPYLNPVFLFPTGAINELSSVPLVAQNANGFFADTAFITQSGIHAFNAVAQAQRESNNFPLGAPIQGLLLNPQANTCATNYDDYGVFAVSTIFGKGALFYDTIRQNWTSLDLSFGDVKQFANTRVGGRERLFYITHDSRVYEAFAGTAANTTRIYLGEWTPQMADQDALVHMVDVQFLNVKSAGHVKFSLYANGELKDSAVIVVNSAGYTDNFPIPIPFTNAVKTASPGWQFEVLRGWNFGIMIEWDFDGALSEVTLDGKVQTAESVSLEKSTFIAPETFAVIGCSGYDDELNTFVDFVDGFLCVSVVKGREYIYVANGNGRLVNGSEVVTTIGIFTAKGSTVSVEGSGTARFSLRTATDYLAVLAAIAEEKVDNLLGAGNHTYDGGTTVDIQAAAYPLKQTLQPTAGTVDVITQSGELFYNHFQIPAFYSKSYTYVDVFFFNSNPSVPEGTGIGSVQAQWLQTQLGLSTKPFKLVVTNNPGSLPYSTWGASAVISSENEVMQRKIVNGFPYFISGAGSSFRGTLDSSVAFCNNTVPGYLLIKASPLSCEITFRDTANEVLDSYALYS
jgi:hypothetical protein